MTDPNDHGAQTTLAASDASKEIGETLPAISSAWRTTNVGYRLFGARHLFIQDKLSRVWQAGFPAVTNSIAGLFHHLDEGGTRLTTLAERAAMTKQSMRELVDRAAEQGLVERRPDPEDGRAKIISFTPDGRILLTVLREAIKKTEARMASHVGSEFIGLMKMRLLQYCFAVRGPDHLDIARSNSRWRKQNAGRVLLTSSDSFAQHVSVLASAATGMNVSLGLLTFFRAMPLTGVRLSDLADAARITKPAMTELVERAVVLGLAERQSTSAGRPAKLIAFTPAGLQLLEVVHGGVTRAEQNMVDTVGQDFVDELKLRLKRYMDAMAIDEARQARANFSM